MTVQTADAGCNGLSAAAPNGGECTACAAKWKERTVWW